MDHVERVIYGDLLIWWENCSSNRVRRGIILETKRLDICLTVRSVQSALGASQRLRHRREANRYSRGPANTLRDLSEAKRRSCRHRLPLSGSLSLYQPLSFPSSLSINISLALPLSSSLSTYLYLAPSSPFYQHLSLTSLSFSLSKNLSLSVRKPQRELNF